MGKSIDTIQYSLLHVTISSQTFMLSHIIFHGLKEFQPLYRHIKRSAKKRNAEAFELR